MCVSPPFVSAHWIWWLSAESASPFLFFWYISYPPMMNVVQEVSRIERRRKWTIFWSWGRFFSSPIDIHFNQQLDLMAISLHLLLNRIESIFYDFFFQEEWKFQFCFFFLLFLLSRVFCPAYWVVFPFLDNFIHPKNLSRSTAPFLLRRFCTFQSR